MANVVLNAFSEDFADCATDELIGWTERKKEKDTEPVRHKGHLDGFELSRTDVEKAVRAPHADFELDQAQS